MAEEEYKTVHLKESNADLVFEQNKRTAQQNIQATAITPRTLGLLSESAGVSSISTTLAPGSQVVFQLLTYQNGQKTYAASKRNTSIFIDSAATTANLLPGGSSITEDDWIWSIHEPLYYHTSNAGVTPPAVAGQFVDENVQCTIVFVQNNSAVSHDVYLLSNTRLIIEQGGGTNA